MEIKGRLSECGYQGLLQLVEHSQLSGCLTLHQSSLRDRSSELPCQVWFEQGRIVAVTWPGESNSLFRLIHKQGWMGYNALERLGQICPAQLPVGAYFYQQGILKAMQLQRVFQAQLLAILKLLAAQEDLPFSLVTGVALPYAEMTGLNLAIADAIDCIRQQGALSPGALPLAS